MRTLCVATVFLSLSALAQSPNGGVWTGYVGGWKPDAQPARPVFNDAQPRRQPRVVVVPYYVPVQQIVQPSQPDRQAAEQAEQRRLWEAEQARLAQQTQLETERRLAAEREQLLQQQLESERRLAAEREALAAQKLKLEQEERARQVAALQPPPPPPEPAKPAAPETPGNDIYRWTDADGVVHYSTNVPAAMKGSATKVGGSR